MNTEITGATRLNMREKLAWAERSFERMQRTKDVDLDSVQDHFWSFLHATHLLWFYFGRWAKGCHPKRSAKKLLDVWRDQKLTTVEVKAWNCLLHLRDEDAHVQPVVAMKPRDAGRLVTKEGRIMVSKEGKVMVSTEKPFRVVLDGEELELFPLCESSLDALRKFVDKFDDIKQL